MAEAVAKHLKDFVEHNSSGKEILTMGTSETAPVQSTQSEPVPAADNSRAVEPRVESGPAIQPGTIIVKSTPPGCDINVDGKFMGSTPSTIQLSPGEHFVSVEKEGLTPWQRTMTITAGGSATIDATLEKP